jgi:predicted O-methyltransferase YrrM
VNSVLREILETDQIRTERGESIALHSNVSRKEGEFLQSVIRELKPVVTLEVGFAYGISALFICDALEVGPDTRHIVIDPNQFISADGQQDAWGGVGMYNVQRAGFGDIVELRGLPSHQALPQLEAEGVSIDFAFIDGWHTFDFALVDFFYIDRLLKVGGVVAFDDADMPAIRKLCRYVALNRAYRVVTAGKAVDVRRSLRRRLLERLLASGKLGPRVRRVLSPETLRPNRELGLAGSCVAFMKRAADDRSWDFHASF